MDYEKKLAELEELVGRLEDGDVSLDESVKLFERGVELTRACMTELKTYKGKISAVSDELDELTRSE